MTLDQLKKKIFTTCRQPMREDFMTKVISRCCSFYFNVLTQVQEVKLAVFEKLKAREDMAFAPEWKEWFAKIPTSSAEPHSSYFNVLAGI